MIKFIDSGPVTPSLPVTTSLVTVRAVLYDRRLVAARAVNSLPLSRPSTNSSATYRVRLSRRSSPRKLALGYFLFRGSAIHCRISGGHVCGTSPYAAGRQITLPERKTFVRVVNSVSERIDMSFPVSFPSHLWCVHAIPPDDKYY